MPFTLHTLPVEMVYRILDHLNTFTILVSCRNVCKKLNDITDTYHRYQVILIFHFQAYCSSFFQYIHIHFLIRNNFLDIEKKVTSTSLIYSKSFIIFYSFKYVQLLMLHRYRNISKNKEQKYQPSQ